MPSYSIRARIEQALLEHPQPRRAAQAIADSITEVTQGTVRPRKGWVNSLLYPMTEGALDRASGAMDVAALSLSRDLAISNPFGLVENGWFKNDERVMLWHQAETERQKHLHA